MTNRFLTRMAQIQDGYYTIDDDEFVGFANLDYTVRFVDAITPYPLDLTGFGDGDKLIIDGYTNFADWYGLLDDFRDMLGKTAGFAFTARTVSGTDFGIYPATRTINNYMYGSIEPSAYAYVYLARIPSSGNASFASLNPALSKFFGRASLLYSSKFKNHLLAKGLPVSSGTGFEYLIDVMKPDGTTTSYP